MEDTVIRSQFSFSGRSAALARSRTSHRSLLYCSRKPKQLPTTRVVCSSLHFPSIARWVHSLQYFPLPALSFFWYGSTSRLGVFDDHPLHFFMLVWSPLYNVHCLIRMARTSP